MYFWTAELVRKMPLFTGDSELQQLLHIFRSVRKPQYYSHNRVLPNSVLSPKTSDNILKVNVTSFDFMFWFVQVTWHTKRDNLAWRQPTPRLARVSPVEASGPVPRGSWTQCCWLGPSRCKFSWNIFWSVSFSNKSSSMAVHSSHGRNSVHHRWVFESRVASTFVL